MKPRTDEQLIADLVERLGGRLEPQELAGVLEGAGLRLELRATITRTTSQNEVDQHRSGAIAELNAHDGRAAQCECSLARPRIGSFSRGQCDGRTIVAAIVTLGYDYVTRGADGLFAKVPRYRFVCGRHLKSHGVAPADLIAVVHLTPRELAPVLKRRQMRLEQAAQRARKEEEARTARALTLSCPTCHAPPGQQCSGRYGTHATPHYDRLLAADRVDQTPTAPGGGA